jgi:hypothetical protein
MSICKTTLHSCMVLIDRFNAILVELVKEASFSHVRYVDLRNTLSVDLTNDAYKAWWDNELHPTESGFSAVAAKFAAALSTLGQLPNQLPTRRRVGRARQNLSLTSQWREECLGGFSPVDGFKVSAAQAAAKLMMDGIEFRQRRKGGFCAEACFEVASVCQPGCGHGMGGGKSLHRRVEAEPIEDQDARRDEG